MIIKNINLLLAKTAVNGLGCTYTEIPLNDLQKYYREYSIGLNAYVHRFDDNPVNMIYRGKGKIGSGIIYDAKPGERISQNTNNFYTILFSYILPSWKSYPQRSKSFICASTEYLARCYSSTVYIVIPKNSAKIGICPTDDMWNSFRDWTGGGSSINALLNNIFMLFQDVLYESGADNLTEESVAKVIRNLKYGSSKVEDLLHCFKRVERFIKNVYNSEDRYSLNNIKNHLAFEINDKLANTLAYFMQRLINGDCIVDIFETIFKPNTNGFVCCPYYHYDNYIKNHVESHESGREVWLDSECLLIEANANAVDAAELTLAIKKFIEK